MKEYNPYIFFAPLPDKEKSEKQLNLTQNYQQQFSERFLFFDTETEGFFQNKLIFGGLVINKMFVFGCRKSRFKKMQEWLTELFASDTNLQNYTFALYSEDEYFDFIYSFKGYIVGANPLFDLSRGITSYMTDNRKKPGLIRNDNYIDVKDRGYGDIIKKYTVISDERVIKKHEYYKKKDIKKEKLIKVKEHTITVKKKLYDAQILDVLQIGSGVAGTHISLGKLCSILHTSVQKIEHPYELIKFDKTTLQYMIYDILATKESFNKLREIFNDELSLLARIVSPASVGKHVLRKCCIHKPIFTHDEDKRRLYEAYYGGRSEVNYRGLYPLPLFNLDFLSQYPVLQIVLDLQRFMLAKEIECVDRTSDKELINKIENIKLNDLKNPELWKELSGIVVKVNVKDARMPIRIKYRDSVNIQLPYLTTSNPLWYSIFDYLAGKMYGNGSMKIVEIKEYIVKSKQDKLKSYNIFGIDIHPTSIFLDLLKYRIKLKSDLKIIKLKPEVKDFQRLKIELDIKILGVKYLLNSTSYGATIERNERTMKKMSKYMNTSDESITSTKKLVEGAYSCPIIGIQITGSGRLLIAICEILELKNNNRRLPFIDTDGISAKTDADKIAFFAKFSPIPIKQYLEYDDEELTDFYGIAPKRYLKIKDNVLWDKGMRIHGLGTYNSFLRKDKITGKPELAMKALSVKLDLIDNDNDNEMFLNEPVISQVSANTCLTLKTLQNKCSWIKPYSFGFSSIPDTYAFMDIKGRDVRIFNEKLKKLNMKELDAFVCRSGILDHKKILENYFEYKAQKYDILHDTGWNEIPHVKVSSSVNYITKMSGQAYVDALESFITDKEKQLRKIELKHEDISLVSLFKWKCGIINVKKILPGYCPKRGLSKKERIMINRGLGKL